MHESISMPKIDDFDTFLPFQDDLTKSDLPCLNCKLIEMGEMACYQGICPQCGREPPGKQAYRPRPQKPKTNSCLFPRKGHREVSSPSWPC